MKLLITLLGFVAVVFVGVVGFAYSGLYDVSANTPHNGLTTWLLKTTSHASVKRQAESVEPPDLSDSSLVEAGVNDFAAMCVSCHGAPGEALSAMGQGLNPPAPNLAESAAHLSAKELFWVTKNGIKMTGMPSWGATHDDEALWPMVAFMTKLPDMDGAAYQALLISAQGQGHHSGDHNEGHSHEENGDDEHGADEGHHESTAEPTEPSEHDHSSHDH
ncbi:MAG: hypothetical protein GXP16_15775 [Gammaproteobacteria bacterium]|nr:hypothetical protein [Gammaproteobacteria bacterium]